MIPNVFHFIFGLSKDFGNKPFSLCHYIAIQSAITVNKPDKVYFYYKYKPTGEWFEKIENQLELVKVEPPESIFGNKLHHFAHQTGVMRLQVLLENGGIYMDMDTISIKPLTQLLNNKCVLGEQIAPGYQSIHGLCDGIILSEKNSDFIKDWLLSYKSHRSKGHDQYWDEHAVYMPYYISLKYPDKIHTETFKSFHYPIWDDLGLKMLFEEDHTFDEAYCHHLWESSSWDYLKELTVDKIKNIDTTYNRIARRFI